MNATMMHFATILPDWNSLESVRRAHTDFEGAALVFFALLVAAEALAHLTENKSRERLFDKIGICFFAIAVLAEIAAFPYGQRNDSLSEQLIGSLDAKARQASSDASQALTISGTALSQAKDALSKTGAAEGAMKSAENEAKSARNAASSALTLAQGARTEADSFEKDIVSARQQAADAESHFAQAEAELNKIRSPRSIVDEPALIAELTPFQDTEYTFSVFQDEEAIQFTKKIDRVLGAAGWRRKPTTARLLGITYFNVFSQDFKDSVPVCVETGVHVHTPEKESVEVLQSIPLMNRPKTLQAAGALIVALAPHVSPSDERNVGNEVGIEKGSEEGPVTICVGKKP